MMRPRVWLCMPVLHVSALFFLWCRRSRPIVGGVGYGILPRWLRFTCKLTRCGEPGLVAFVRRWWRLDIQKIRHDGGTRDYPALNLRAMEAVIPATLSQEEGLAANHGVKLLAQLVGKEPAMAFYLQQLAANDVWPLFVHTYAYLAELDPEAKLLVVADPTWNPAEVERAISSAKEFAARVEIYTWPRWWSRSLQEARGLSYLVAASAKLAAAAARALIARPRASARNFRVATEFIQPDRLNGGTHDADFFVDGAQIKTQEVLVFVTPRHAAHLRKRGLRQHLIRQLTEARGYLLVWMPDLAPTREVLGRLTGAMVAASRSASFARIFWSGWLAYLETSPLFSTYQVEAILHVKFPNGNADWRRDSAIWTGIARQHAIPCVGLQNRAIYAAHYEFAFDCYDKWLAWGPAWLNGLAPTEKFIRKIVAVGCFYSDSHCRGRHALMPAARPIVLIFTGDLGGSHYTENYNISFLSGVVSLAEKHPHLDFVIKPKDAPHAGVFRGHPLIAGPIATLSNVRIASNERHRYAELLQEAAMVLAIGFTTPGIEAMLLGKPTLFYSELRGGAQSFSRRRNHIAESLAELQEKFSALLRGGDPDGHFEELDPYRDGQALTRIRNHLSNPC